MTFSLDGASYEIDLNDAHAADLRSAFSTYAAAARKTSGSQRNGRSARAGAGTSTADVLAWAKAHDLEISSRGSIPAVIRKRFDQAH